MISCELYDYIEVVCMFKYPVRLTLHSGAAFDGVAQDTARDELKQECIRITVESGEKLIILDEIRTLEVQVQNPHFERVEFARV